MADLVARIDALLSMLSSAYDLDERNDILNELGQLNRKKVLAHREPPDPAHWMPIPVLSYSRPAATLDENGIRGLIKNFFWIVAAGLAADPAHPTPDQFVTLLRLRTDEQTVRLSLVCPYEGPVGFVERLRAEDLAGPTGDDIRRRIADLEIHHRYNVVEDLLLPVVFVQDRAANRLTLMNHNHFHDPGQFVGPEHLRTASGFLNFVGAVQIKQEVHGQRKFIVSEPESMMNKGFDDWFRWLYSIMETGTLFHPDRMYVNRTRPEDYRYEYAGAARS